MINEKVHFSVDDVLGVFRWLERNKAASIFESYFFEMLRNFYIDYGLHTTLYLFEERENFNISQIKKEYWQDLKENNSWLKFAWHRRKPGNITDDIKAEKESFIRVTNLIKENIGEESVSSIVRLHKWSCGEEFKNFLLGNKVDCLLTSYKNDFVSYDLSPEEIMKIEKESYIKKDGMKYLKTDFCLDNMDDESQAKEIYEKTKSIIKDKDKIVLFCHEFEFMKIGEFIKKYFTKINEDIDVH